MSTKLSSSDLRKIIQERRNRARDRAEQRRLQDLRSIELRNWKNENGKHALKVFPKEIWQQILKYLNTPTDLQNASNSCPLFSELLKPRYFRDSIFPSILGVLRFQEIFLFNDNGKQTYDHFLSLRLVCKSWRTEVDNYFETNLLGYHQEYKSSRKEPPWLDILDVYSFTPLKKPTEKLTKFINDFKVSDSGAKVFITKSIFLSVQYSQVKSLFPYIDHLFTKALNLIGPQTLNFTFEFIDGTYFDVLRPHVKMSLTEMYRLLSKWLKLMPNLQFLDVRIAGIDTALEQGLSPFPSLNLHKLTLDVGFTQEVEIYEEILRSNQNLKWLHLKGRIFPRLQNVINSLQLESFSVCSKYSTLHLEDIKQLVNVKWDLVQMNLDFHSGIVSVKELFQFLERFPKLKRVSLGMCDGRYTEFIDGNYLNLEELKEFEFFFKQSSVLLDKANPVTKFITGVDYLVKAEGLERIAWRNMSLPGRKRLKSKEELISFYGALKDLYKSNIWNVFPMLGVMRERVASSKAGLKNGGKEKASDALQISRIYRRKFK